MDRRDFVSGALVAGALGMAGKGMASSHDVVISGGKAFINGAFVGRDIGIAGGKIAAVSEPGSLRGSRVVDARGMYVSPGWVDLHVHYVDLKHGKTAGSTIAQLGAEQGVTALLDAGTTGAKNYARLERAVADGPDIDCFAMLNIKKEGIKLSDFYSTKAGWDDLDAMEKVIADNPRIVALKYRADHTVSPKDDRLYYVRRIREAGDAFGLPAIIHIGSPPPTLSDILPLLKEGDMITHCFRSANNSVVTPGGELREDVKDAMERGVRFDVGHGMSSYSFFSAERAMDQGLTDFTLSSDLYFISRPFNARTFGNVMTNALASGMSIEEVVYRVSEKPAEFLGLERKISPGSEATLSIFEVRDGRFVCKDASGEKRDFSRRVFPAKTVIRGEVVEAGARDRKLYL